MWARLAQAAVRELEGSQFEPVPRQQAQAILQGRKLGVAKLRLLPKRTGGGPGPPNATPSASLSGTLGLLGWFPMEALVRLACIFPFFFQALLLRL